MGTEASARLVSFSLIILCIIFTLCQLGSGVTNQSTNQKLPDEEVSALDNIVWKLDLDTPMSSERSFCNESSYDGIDGITCDCTFQEGTICHITEIDLRSKDLTGSIPKELANLTYLKTLDLSNNQLTGSIPASLGNLPSLNILKLYANQLTGPIPESLGNIKFKVSNRACLCTNSSSQRGITVEFALDLADNQLNGSIPATLGNVAVSSMTSDPNALQLFKLKHYDRANVQSVFYLDLSSNQLTGAIPKSLGKLTFASYILLYDNFLNGSIPASLGALTYLETLSLSDNGISGALPQTLGDLINLEYFLVGSNNITGTLPKSFASLTNLSAFSVAGNYLSGPLPDFIANWTSITALYLNGNNFHGKIPAGIFNLSDLRSLVISDVGDSNFQFPPSANVTRSLITLILRNCSITGQIPSYIGDMSRLRNLDLSFNKLTGKIPDSLKNSNLSYLDLSYNNLSNLSFKPSPKLEPNLFSCCCNSSTCLPNMTDPITEKYCPRKKPEYHSLFINCGGGETTVDGNVYERDNATSQYYLSPKGNWARSSAGSIVGLQYPLNFSRFLKTVRCGLSSEADLYNNARTFPVSLKYYGFCLRNGVYNVTLHFAEIVDDEKDYKSTDKRVFDVYIQGERKRKDFNIIDKAGRPNNVYEETFTAVSVYDSTLEIHFYSTGKGLDRGPLISAISVTSEYKQRKRLSPLHIALITLASIIVFVLLFLLFAWMMGWLGTDHLQEIDIGLEKPVTLKQLKDATRNFSKRNEIGHGGFGTVYKAEVQGKIVAVKKLSSHSEERINQLKNEFYTLKSMSQENLVQLLDVYNAKGLHLLIYEYMQNNSLAHALFGENI